MKFIYAYIQSLKNIHNQELSLSDEYGVSFARNVLEGNCLA